MHRRCRVRVEAREAFRIGEQHRASRALKNGRLADLDGFVRSRKPLGCQHYTYLAATDRTAKRDTRCEMHAAKTTQAARNLPSSVRVPAVLYERLVSIDQLEVYLR